jgi:rare lipoprotein A
MVNVMNCRKLLPALLVGGCLWLTPVAKLHAQAGNADSKAVTASFYSTRYNGRRTASGQRFSSNALTAAHRSLPFGTKVKLINVKNNRSVVVRVNDRGPFVKGREISVTRLLALYEPELPGSSWKSWGPRADDLRSMSSSRAASKLALDSREMNLKWNLLYCHSVLRHHFSWRWD